MSWKEWYDSLVKPAWTPEPGTIGLVWQILYPIILVSFGYVFVQAVRDPVKAPNAIRSWPNTVSLISRPAISSAQRFNRVRPAANN